MKRLEKEALIADREAVKQVLAAISDDDPLGRRSFEARLADIETQLVEIEETAESCGVVALMFGGEPVQGSRSIDAGFASEIVSTFQELVSKKIAADEFGKLGTRGRVPLHIHTNLAITDLVRGSVGFVLEEVGSNHELAETVVRKNISEITVVIAKTASENSDDFEQAVESLDHRLLLSLQEFFRILDERHATVRIVADVHAALLDSQAVRRGRERVDMTEIIEDESETMIGELLGLLPESRRFEMRLESSGEIIKGSVATAVSPIYLQLIEAPNGGVVGRKWRVKMRTREVRERNKAPRKLFVLLGLLEQL